MQYGRRNRGAPRALRPHVPTPYRLGSERPTVANRIGRYRNLLLNGALLART